MLAQAGPVAGHARRPGIERGPGDAGDAHPVLQNAPQDGERGGRWSALLLALLREVSLLLVVFMLIVFVLDRNTQIAPPGAACEPSTATTIKPLPTASDACYDLGASVRVVGAA